ncbi:hypothetical protein ABPG72_013508 [Tetrahymena utriculariae]
MKQYSSSLESAFDLSTQVGRLEHFKNMMNPMNFFYTEETLMGYNQILKKFDTDPALKSQYTNEELWRIKYVVLSNVHPQTEKAIPYPFRTSAFVLSNTPISFGLAVLPPTPFNQIMSQSINQTFNFCFNYFNRNVSNVYNYSELAMSFSGAVAASIAGSLGTAAFSKKLTFNKTLSNIVLTISPFIGVCVANVCNLAFSRIQDFTKGIQVRDLETGEPIQIQNSFIAAKIAYWQTAASRVIIPIPVFFIPIGGIKLLKYYGYFPKGNLAGNVVSSGLAALGLWVGGTIGFSVFEQNTKCHVNKLEPAFHNLINKNGKKIEYVTYNKGL